MSQFSAPAGGDRLQITDGLRAIAVVAVVLYHFFPKGIRGGFIGVDVFFVISGFVIAHSYLPGLISGQKRIGDFFLRRIQRLLPAYLLLLIVVTAGAYLLLPPMALIKFGQSLAAQAGYLQNIVFWVQGDYFEKAYQKPLLHTWSLAVEEQFYLFFPLLILVFRFNRRLALTLLALAFAGSLALGWVMAGLSPKTAFYLLPMRVWEFAAGIGAALAFGRVSVGRWASPLYLGSIGLLLVSIFAFGERSPFPGPQSLIAVLATVVICLVQREVPALPASVLTNRVAQHVGAISYSWYLWHWPPVVFFHAVFARLPNPWEGAAGVLISYLLAVASWRLVERPALAWAPLRTPRPALALLGLFLGLALLTGLSLVQLRGALHRYPPAQQVLLAAEMDRLPDRCSWLARLQLYDAAICRLAPGAGGKPTLLLGDSHADGTKVVVGNLAAASGAPLYLTKHNCKPIDYGVLPQCDEGVWRQIKADIKRFGIKRVLVVAKWSDTVTEAQYRDGFETLLATGVTVYAEKVVPHGPYFSPRVRARGETPEPYTLRDYDRLYAVQNRTFAALHAQYGDRFQVLDPIPSLCPDGVTCDFATGGKPNYHDTDHLNAVGMSRVAPIYRPVFE